MNQSRGLHDCKASPHLPSCPVPNLGALPAEPWVGSSSITPERFTLAAAALARNSICYFDTQDSHCSEQGKVTGAEAWCTGYVTFVFLGQDLNSRENLGQQRMRIRTSSLHFPLSLFTERSRTRMQPSPDLSTVPFFWETELSISGLICLPCSF